MSDYGRLVDRLNKLRDEQRAVADELMREHVGKGAGWVVSRKRRIDRLQLVIERIERRLR